MQERLPAFIMTVANRLCIDTIQAHGLLSWPESLPPIAWKSLMHLHSDSRKIVHSEQAENDSWIYRKYIFMLGHKLFDLLPLSSSKLLRLRGKRLLDRIELLGMTSRTNRQATCARWAMARGSPSYN